MSATIVLFPGCPSINPVCSFILLSVRLFVNSFVRQPANLPPRHSVLQPVREHLSVRQSVIRSCVRPPVQSVYGPPISLSVPSTGLSLSTCASSVWPFIHPFPGSSIRPSVRLFVRPSARLFVRLSVRPYVHPSVRLFVRPYVRPPARSFVRSSSSLAILYTSSTLCLLPVRLC